MNENGQKYLLGVALAALLALYGAACVLRARVWEPGLLHGIPGGPGLTIDASITGREAVCIGIACLGMAGYLFAHFYLENTVRGTRGMSVTILVEVGGLVVFIVGVAVALWLGFLL